MSAYVTVMDTCAGGEQTVSAPGTGSPATLVCPVEQATHRSDDTCISTAHAQLVSVPEASSPAAFVDPAGHAVHALDDTYWLAPHIVGEHVAAVNDAKEHELVPDTVYPASHVG